MNSQAGRRALSREEATRYLGVSLRTFSRHVQPRLRELGLEVPIGARRLYRPEDLEQWVAEAKGSAVWRNANGSRAVRTKRPRTASPSAGAMLTRHRRAPKKNRVEGQPALISQLAVPTLGSLRGTRVRMMPARTLSAHDRRRVAVAAAVDPRTVARVYRGDAVRPSCAARIADAACFLGFPPPAPRGEPTATALTPSELDRRRAGDVLRRLGRGTYERPPENP
jgi:hypothetical protein